MKEILTINDERVEVNALFLQPTRFCGRNCPDCYVKKHAKTSSRQMPTSTISDILCNFTIRKTGYHANQVTISIDKLPEEYQPEKQNVLGNIFRQAISLSRFKLNTELHITCHSLDDLEETGTKEYNPYSHEMLADFNLISLSNIKDDTISLKKIEELIKFGCNFNYNHLCPTVVNSSNIRGYINHITKVGKVVNSIYLMARKKPTGIEYTAQQQMENATRLHQDMCYIKTILSKVPADVRRKIRIDTCIEDIVNYSRTGYGCSCNISKFHIWPDGTVSGCPYAYSGIGKNGIFFQDIVDNIRKTRRERYEFETGCHLRESYDYLSRR